VSNLSPSFIGLCAQVACVWEATARKPGNVHRFSDFSDVTYLDFVLSAAAIAPVVQEAWRRPVGETVLAGVRASRAVVATNTNLGILLLLAPLAAVAPGESLQTGLPRVLEALDLEDARLVYQAIRLAAPAGLGHVSHEDVHDNPSQGLRQVMTLAADRDLVARQYLTGFREVLDIGVPALLRGLGAYGFLEEAIIGCHLELMARYPDSLIARKRGQVEAEEAARRAQEALERSWPNDARGQAAVVELDRWLRAEANQRNPGTTADLVAASLFAALREHSIALPATHPWSRAADPETHHA
jgi:triphosphoribosyl-dephospho-CoA synthase